MQDRVNAVFMGPVNDSQVKEVFKAGLKVAVEKRMAQDPVVLIPGRIHIFFQNNPVLSQGTGFVRAEHIHFPKGLNGPQGLYDDLVL